MRDFPRYTRRRFWEQVKNERFPKIYSGALRFSHNIHVSDSREWTIRTRGAVVDINIKNIYMARKSRDTAIKKRPLFGKLGFKLLNELLAIDLWLTATAAAAAADNYDIVIVWTWPESVDLRMIFKKNTPCIISSSQPQQQITNTHAFFGGIISKYGYTTRSSPERKYSSCAHPVYHGEKHKKKADDRPWSLVEKFSMNKVNKSEDNQIIFYCIYFAATQSVVDTFHSGTQQ